MIAQLADGTELDFPDDMGDDQIGKFVRMLVAAQNRATELATENERLRSRVEELIGRPNPVINIPPPPDNNAIMERLDSMITVMEHGFNRVAMAASADRVMVPDDLGNYRRSKAVMPN